jgi:hypothetical protein
MQAAMDTQALPVPTLAGTKHDRSAEGDAAEPVAKRRTVDDAMTEYKKACEDHEQLKAQRPELERQKAILDSKLRAIDNWDPKNAAFGGTKKQYTERVREAYRVSHAVKQSFLLFAKQTCPVCQKCPKRRAPGFGDRKCKHCQTVFHSCADYETVSKGKAEDCLGCRKPIV